MILNYIKINLHACLKKSK